MYQIEAYKKNENIRMEFIKQFKLMSWRLWYIITWPSAILASFFGVLLIVINQSLLNQNWMILKIGFVLLLIIYHLKTHMIFLSLQKDKCSYSSNFFRFWNEGATLLLFAYSLSIEVFKTENSVLVDRDYSLFTTGFQPNRTVI